MEQSYEPVWEIMINSGVYNDREGDYRHSLSP